VNMRWHLEQVLLSWIRDGAASEQVLVLQPDPAGRGETIGRWPIAAVLFALTDDPTIVPGDVTAMLGLPRDCSYSRLARTVWCLADGDGVDHCGAVDDLVTGRRRAADLPLDRAPRGPVWAPWQVAGMAGFDPTSDPPPRSRVR
jgi:hypothetical protein